MNARHRNRSADRPIEVETEGGEKPTDVADEADSPETKAATAQDGKVPAARELFQGFQG